MYNMVNIVDNTVLYNKIAKRRELKCSPKKEKKVKTHTHTQTSTMKSYKYGSYLFNYINITLNVNSLQTPIKR